MKLHLPHRLPAARIFFDLGKLSPTTPKPVGFDAIAMHTTPPALLERLRQPGDQAAWQRFAQLYTPLLNYWAQRFLSASDNNDMGVEHFFIHRLA